MNVNVVKIKSEEDNQLLLNYITLMELKMTLE